MTGLLHATGVTWGWNGHWIRVSTQSRLWRRKFPCHSCWDSNSQPFDHESGALTNKLSRLPHFVVNTQHLGHTSLWSHWHTHTICMHACTYACCACTHWHAHMRMHTHTHTQTHHKTSSGSIECLWFGSGFDVWESLQGPLSVAVGVLEMCFHCEFSNRQDVSVATWFDVFFHFRVCRIHTMWLWIRKGMLCMWVSSAHQPSGSFSVKTPTPPPPGRWPPLQWRLPLFSNQSHKLKVCIYEAVRVCVCKCVCLCVCVCVEVLWLSVHFYQPHHILTGHYLPISVHLLCISLWGKEV